MSLLPHLGTWELGRSEETCRYYCRTAYLGDHTLRCRVLGQFLLYADTRDVGITPHLAMDGYSESWIIAVFTRTIQPGWHCIDVGANHGYYTLLMGAASVQNGRVLALEPNGRLVSLLQQTVSVNAASMSPVQVISGAAWDEDGCRLMLSVPDRYGMNGAVLAPGDPQPSGRQYTSEEVETATLDRLTAEWPRVDSIKIDAEGGEQRIWRGMRQTLRRNPAIIILLEFRADRYKDPVGFLSEIEAEGFSLRQADFDGAIKPLPREEALSGYARDWMLWLQR